MPPESAKLLFDAISAARAAQEFVATRTQEDYLADLMLRSAVERQLYILGEALSQLRQIDPTKFDQIPDARRIVAFRNVLAHGYAQIDDARVWSIVETDLPAALSELETMLPDG